MKLIIDVDTGIDDALALLYVLASPEAELLAVTCTTGNVEAGQVAENTLALLEMCGRGDIEVALGKREPLKRTLITAPETHGPKGIGYAVLPAPSRGVSQRHSADLIAEEVRRAPGEVTLITLGPLTNLALAVEREPNLPNLARNLVMMAGSYRSPGNTAPTSEWNVACDPEAMQAVLSAWEATNGVGRPVADLPIALGLDVTERAKFLPDHLARLYAAASNPPANCVLQFIDDALRFYMEFHSRYDGFYGAFIHDALAVASALEPDLLTTEALPVQVELDGTLTSGETVTDWRRVWNRPPNLDIGVNADIDKFFARYIERVGGLAARVA